MRHGFVSSLLAAVVATTNAASAAAQQPDLEYHTDDPTLPNWVQRMYSEDPDVFAVDREFQEWFATHSAEKSWHTQYYKRWRRRVQPYVGAGGRVRVPSLANRQFAQSLVATRRGGGGGGGGGGGFAGSPWECVGPFETFHVKDASGQKAVSWQANVYCIDAATSDPNVLYCGSEAGGVFKSTDHGLTWASVTDAGLRVRDVEAIEVDPTDEDTVFFGAGESVWRSSNGGLTWSVVLSNPGMWTNEILVLSSYPQIVLVASAIGLHRSSDGGSTWSLLDSNANFDLEEVPGRPKMAYLVRDNPTTKLHEFWKSNDSGQSWSLKSSGWYSSSDPARYVGGARLTVTPADPKRVYAVLIGESKAGDDGFIGVWRSDDRGETWTLPNGQIGGPYGATHPNLIAISQTGGYHQGFYNLALAADDTVVDSILVGGLNLWRSTDAAASWSQLGGYAGSVAWIHPDIQDLHVAGGETWLSSDGGVNLSSDFFSSHEARNDGITASDFWGFDQGFGDDSMVGGRYHNGNTATFRNYPAGDFLRLGGAEAPTGYISPGAERKTLCSDIGGWQIPKKIFGQLVPFSVVEFPNESYWVANSSEFEWHPRDWKWGYIGRQHELRKTVNLGASFTSVATFGIDPTAWLTFIECPRADPNVLWVVQLEAARKLWRSNDAGTTWTDVTPTPYRIGGQTWRNPIITCNPQNPRELWLALAYGDDGFKVFRTKNAGGSWTNLTTPTLDGERPLYLVHQAGTQGGIYVGCEGAVYYLDDTLPDWTLHGTGYPWNADPVRMKPWYHDAKLRVATYGRSIWQVDFALPSSTVAWITADKFTAAPGVPFEFRDRSVLDQRGSSVSWSWSFPGGSPSSSTSRDPLVTYSATGNYDVTLTVTDSSGNVDTETLTAFIKVR
ncbi:MAG: PKD domain-containing protein [Planctomycetes bacterium]|nr:PKD domain-containing protein [Planctomycetota bacterium]